jgi:hypothetical protein
MVPVHGFIFSFDGKNNSCPTDRERIKQTNGSRHLLVGFVFTTTYGW